MLQHIEHYIAAAKGTFTLKIHIKIRTVGVEFASDLLRILVWILFVNLP